MQLTAAANLSTTEDIYIQVVRGKTAALFAAACEVGGEIAGVPQDQVAALRTYGDALGIAFQIVDDVLNSPGGQQVTGGLSQISGGIDDAKTELVYIDAEQMETSSWPRDLARVTSGRRKTT